MPAEKQKINHNVALVARHPDLAGALVDRFHVELGWQPIVRDFDSINTCLSRDSDGLLFVAIESDDVRLVTHLIHDISLQQLPPTVIVAIPDAAIGSLHLPWIPDLAEAVHWPSEAVKLVGMAHDFGECSFPFACPDDLPLEQVLRQTLQEQTPSLTPLVDRIVLAAQHDVTVLLTGETGSGKTYCAKLIHEHSPRKKHRFLQVSCGALADNLVESEFFGHVRGAFTGADRNKLGKFAAVGKGTLLLDEIDTLSLKHQAALLRVIESGEFEPIGSVETQKCQARLLVASNIPLERAVEDGDFRSDLYFRLNVMSFHFSPLRERVRDIEPLARGMAARFNRKFDKDLFRIRPQALAALEAFPWPGNIRQLENAIQHAVLVSNGPELQLQHLPELIREHALDNRPALTLNGNFLEYQRDKSERNAVQRALIQHGYNRSRAAEELGISRVTLYKKMDKHGLTEIPIPAAGHE